MASPTQQPSTYPIWISQPEIPIAVEGNAYSYQFLANDPDGDTITFSKIAGSLPEGLNISSTGLLSGTPVNISETTTYKFVVRADTRPGPGSDANDAVDRTFLLTVNDVNSSVVFNYVTEPYDFGNNELGTLINYDIDVSGDTPISLRTINYIDSTISHNTSTVLTSSGDQLNINDITISFGENNVLAVIDNINAFVANTGVIAKAVDDSGSYYIRLYTIVTTGSENIVVDDVTAGLTNTLFGVASISQNANLLPDGLSITETSINGVLLEPVGTYNFSLQAYNNISTDEYSFVFSVVSTITPKPPVWLSNSDLGDYFGGQKTIVELNAVSPEGNGLTYTLESGSVLPAGSSISSDGILIVVTPVVQVQRDFLFTIRVTDDVNSEFTTKTFFITALVAESVVDSTDWQIPSGSIGSIIQGEKSEFQLLLQGADSFTEFEINRGCLPPGLELNQTNGLIIGRPFPVDNDTVYDFEIYVYRYEFDESLGVPVRVHLTQLNRTFSLTVLKKYDDKRFNSLIKVSFNTNETRLLTKFVSDFLTDESIYRSSDDNFGLQNKLTIPINNNILLPCTVSNTGISTINTKQVATMDSNGNIQYDNIIETGSSITINGINIIIAGTTANDIITAINNQNITNVKAKLIPISDISLNYNSYPRYQKNQEIDGAFEEYIIEISQINMTETDYLLVSSDDFVFSSYLNNNVLINNSFIGTNIFYKEHHGFIEGTPIKIWSENPGSLNTSITYYIKYVDRNSFRISTTIGGAALSFTNPTSDSIIFSGLYASEESVINYFYGNATYNDPENTYKNYSWLDTKEFPLFINNLKSRTIADENGNDKYDIVFWELSDKFTKKNNTVGTSPTTGSLPFHRVNDPYSQPSQVHPASLQNISNLISGTFGFEFPNEVITEDWLLGDYTIGIPVVYTVVGQGQRTVDWFNENNSETKNFALGKKILIDRVEAVRYDQTSWYEDRSVPININNGNPITTDISEDVIETGAEILINGQTVTLDDSGLTLLNVIDTINSAMVPDIQASISGVTTISSISNTSDQLILPSITENIPSSTYGNAIEIGTYSSGTKETATFHTGQYAINSSSFNISTDTIFVFNNNYVNGDEITFLDITVNTTPSASSYFVYDRIGHTFKLSTTYPAITPVSIDSVVDSLTSRISVSGVTGVSIKTFVDSLTSRIAFSGYSNSSALRQISVSYLPDSNKDFYIYFTSENPVYFNSTSIQTTYKLYFDYGLSLINTSGGTIKLECLNFDSTMTNLKITSKSALLFNEISIPFRYKKDKEI